MRFLRDTIIHMFNQMKQASCKIMTSNTRTSVWLRMVVSQRQNQKAVKHVKNMSDYCLVTVVTVSFNTSFTFRAFKSLKKLNFNVLSA